MKRAPTLEGLERALRHAAQDKRIRLREASLKSAAGLIEWDGDGDRGALVTLDPDQRGRVYLFVHELLHWVKRYDAAEWGELEEPQIDALSVEVTKRIEGSVRRMAWWRRVIRSKLKGAI